MQAHIVYGLALLAQQPDEVRESRLRHLGPTARSFARRWLAGFDPAVGWAGVDIRESHWRALALVGKQTLGVVGLARHAPPPIVVGQRDRRCLAAAARRLARDLG